MEDDDVYYWSLAQGLIDQARKDGKLKIEVHNEILDVVEITFHKDGFIILKTTGEKK